MWCCACDRCQIAKDNQQAPQGFMGQLLASRPNEILAIDYTALEPSSDRWENVLVMTDVLVTTPWLGPHKNSMPALLPKFY